MKRGLNSSTKCTAIAPSIRAQGFDFVVRYYSADASKNIDLDEARALTAAGLLIAVVWEASVSRTEDPRAPGYFTRLRGVRDGTAAYQEAIGLHQPGRSTIYFAVDFDPTPESGVISGAITDYYRGVADGFAASAGNQAPAYDIGVYGSGSVCQWLLSHALVTFTWLSMSAGWSGSKTFTSWNMRQAIPAKSDPILDVSYDLDTASEVFGGFQVVL